MRKKIQQQYVMLRPSEKELSFMQSWEHIRENPKWKYLLIHGILKEGLFIFLFIKFIQFVYEKEAFTIFYSSFSGFIFLSFEVLFWLFGGFVIGWFKYNSREIEYELLKGLSD